MRCPTCGEWADTKERHEEGEGFIIVRERACPRGHTHKTFEVDESLERTVVKVALRPERIRGLEDRALRFTRDRQILAMLRQGHKHSAIASEFRLSDTMVSTIARRHGFADGRRITRKAQTC